MSRYARKPAANCHAIWKSNRSQLIAHRWRYYSTWQNMMKKNSDNDRVHARRLSQRIHERAVPAICTGPAISIRSGLS